MFPMLTENNADPVVPEGIDIDPIIDSSETEQLSSGQELEGVSEELAEDASESEDDSGVDLLSFFADPAAPPQSPSVFQTPEQIAEFSRVSAILDDKLSQNKELFEILGASNFGEAKEKLKALSSNPFQGLDSDDEDEARGVAAQLLSKVASRFDLDELDYTADPNDARMRALEARQSAFENEQRQNVAKAQSEAKIAAWVQGSGKQIKDAVAKQLPFTVSDESVRMLAEDTLSGAVKFENPDDVLAYFLMTNPKEALTVLRKTSGDAKAMQTVRDRVPKAMTGASATPKQEAKWNAKNPFG